MDLQGNDIDRPPKIILIMWLAGGAHWSACNSIKIAIERSRLPWEVHIVNLVRDICPNIDPLERYFNCSNENLYNFLLQHGFFTLINTQFKIGALQIKLVRKKAINTIKKYMLHEKPDFVISAIHHFNGPLSSALQDLGIPFGVVPTEVMDLEDTPIWFAPEACNYASFFTLPTPEMVEQGHRLGAGDNCMLAGGLPINPIFFDPLFQKMSTQKAQKHFNLDQNVFTILLTMGAMGGKSIYNIIKELENSSDKLQIIACCGRDENLKIMLDNLKSKFKNKITPMGFTSEMHILLKASDVIITKPGPTSIWEALVVGIPIVIDAQKTIIWERPQIEFIVKHNFGKIVKERFQLLKTIENLIANNRMELKVIQKKIETFEKKEATSKILETITKILRHTRINKDKGRKMI